MPCETFSFMMSHPAICWEKVSRKDMGQGGGEWVHPRVQAAYGRVWASRTQEERTAATVVCEEVGVQTLGCCTIAKLKG